ncbi:MAG TPA: DUF2490 domain-containing protein [Flavipsychrobacter sp.]|nr:DUF2490 domain-containing protein [Flavipsychrobacter sp.]
MNGFKKMLVTAIGAGFAQTLPAQTHHNIWFRTTVSYQVSEKVKADVELQHRRQNGFENDNMLDKNLMCSFRSWLHYQYNKHTGFSVSPFAYFTNYPIIQNVPGEPAKPFHEIRFAAAMDNRNKIMGKWGLLERSALEYRIPDNSIPRTLRLRSRLGLQYAATSRLGLSVYDELFCNIAGVSASHFFDHNRIGLTFEYRISPGMKLEAGYIYISRLPLAEGILRREHNIMMNFTCQLKKRRGKLS